MKIIIGINVTKINHKHLRMDYFQSSAPSRYIGVEIGGASACIDFDKIDAEKAFMSYEKWKTKTLAELNVKLQAGDKFAETLINNINKVEPKILIINEDK